MPTHGLAQLRSALQQSVQQHKESMTSLHMRMQSCADTAFPLRSCMDDVALLEAWSCNLAQVLRYTDSNGHSSSTMVPAKVAGKMPNATHPLSVFSNLRIPEEAFTKEQKVMALMFYLFKPPNTIENLSLLRTMSIINLRSLGTLSFN